MSYIFKGVDNAGQDMWGSLVPPTVNEVWEIMTWDEKAKAYVVDKANGRLRKIGTRPSLPTMAQEGGFYKGHLPSERVCEYINSLKEKMRFFDDGVRMRYGRPDYTVEVEPVAVKHPIKYPPPNFELVNDQWVLIRRSKYA